MFLRTFTGTLWFVNNITLRRSAKVDSIRKQICNASMNLFNKAHNSRHIYCTLSWSSRSHYRIENNKKEKFNLEST